MKTVGVPYNTKREGCAALASVDYDFCDLAFLLPMVSGRNLGNCYGPSHGLDGVTTANDATCVSQQTAVVVC